MILKTHPHFLQLEIKSMFNFCSSEVKLRETVIHHLPHRFLTHVTFKQSMRGKITLMLSSESQLTWTLTGRVMWGIGEPGALSFWSCSERNRLCWEKVLWNSFPKTGSADITSIGSFMEYIAHIFMYTAS